MGLLDIITGKKKKADKIKRPPKGALKSVEKAKTGKPAASPKDKQAGKKEGKSDLGSTVILSPFVTEKTTLLSEKGVYVFKVDARANKQMVKQAIKELYSFQPRKIRIINIPSKTRFSRGKAGVKPGYKKALVYLKQGDKIDLV